MLKNVIKHDGTIEEFSAEKLNKWAQYATKTGGNWSEIAMETYKRLPETAKSSDIHQMMVNVCLDKEEITYSRIAARLEQASLRKNMERILGVSDRGSFKDIFDAMIEYGVWCKNTLPEYNPVWESWYEEIYPTKLEYWQIVQWGDKYSLRKKSLPVETPHVGAMGIGLGLHGDTEHAYSLIKAIIHGKVNLPTPALNGIRNGDFDTISCCIITGGDSVDSIGVAEHIAYKMTAKKAGIGIEFDTRSKGSPVKGGAVDHLGKHSIYSCLDKAVKMFTQMCYDGETEVLTARGWKYFKDLVPEDLIAQVNDDRTLEFVPHTTFVSYEINQDKKMVKFSNKYVNAFVTDNHKMVYRTKKYESPVTSAGSYSECRADEFRASRCNVLDFGGHKVGSIDKLSAQDKFRIALQADGTVRVNKTCENTYVFTFNKQRKISEFRDLLGQLGLEEKWEKSQDRGYSVNLRKNGNGVGTIFTVSKVGFDCDKSLSWVYDRDFSCEWGKEFLEYVSKWDATTTGTHFEYYTKDMQNVDVVQFVAACCGLYSKVDGIKGRSCYTVRVSQFESVTSEGVKKEIVEDYIGKVYCVEVPSHRLVVRREGRTLVCGNTRGGSATVTFKCIDPEVESLLMWKTQRVDIETRLDKMDYSFAYNDAFLQAVIKDEEWYLFDLVEAPEIHEAFYTMKAGPYMQLVKEEIAKGKKTKKVKARDILRGMLIARNETGRMYSINVTRVNEHSPFIDVVRLSNLCVAPETQILTKRGYVPIAELEGEKVEVWNGKEWSEVDVVKTGVDQKLIKVTTNSGYEIECTPYHKFYISTAYHSPYKEVRACDLKPGDKLAKFDLPVVDGEEELENAYINGFYSGDGCLTDQGQRIYLYGEKRQLAEFFNEGGKWTIQDDLNRQYNHFRTLKDKYFVPSNGFTVKSRLDWLAGYLDADGCVYRNGGNEQLVASSVEKNFLREVQMMLQTLGVSAKITKMGDEGFRLMPANDGSGELKEFWCQESYRLLITSCDAYKLQSMGLKLNRLKLTMQKPQRDAKQFVKIVSVLDEGRVDDTYCFTEPKRHMGMFNGLLTGQCQEITLPTKAYKNMPDLYSEESEGETAFCTLAAINAGKVGFDEYEHNAGVALRAVDRMIDLAPMMTKSMENSIRKRRSAGIGIMGLASALYNNGLDYDGTEASLGFVSKLAEHHYFYLLKASQKLAEEAGYGVGGINLNWLPIDTRVNKYPLTLDWESLRGKPRKNSVLAAHMPTESSALFSDGPNSVYPPRQAVINKKSRKGLVQYICKEWDSSKKLAWDVDNITLAKYYSAIQDMTDQAISADYYFDPSKYADEKKPLSELMKEWVAQAKMGNKTQYYMNTRDYNGGSVQDVMKASVPEEESCESCKL